MSVSNFLLHLGRIAAVVGVGFHNLVGVEGEVNARFPFPVVVRHNVVGESGFDTLVTNQTGVNRLSLTASGGAHEIAVSEVGVIVCEVPVEGVAEHRDVETGFERLRFFGSRIIEIAIARA